MTGTVASVATCSCGWSAACWSLAGAHVLAEHHLSRSGLSGHVVTVTP